MWSASSPGQVSALAPGQQIGSTWSQQPVSRRGWALSLHPRGSGKPDGGLKWCCAGRGGHRAVLRAAAEGGWKGACALAGRLGAGQMGLMGLMGLGQGGSGPSQARRNLFPALPGVVQGGGGGERSHTWPCS